MKTSPYVAPSEYRRTVEQSKSRRMFGWWIYLILHLFAVATIANASMQVAFEDAKDFADDLNVLAKVNPTATAMYLACMYLPLLLVAPWLGQWVHKAGEGPVPVVNWGHRPRPACRSGIARSGTSHEATLNANCRSHLQRPT